MMGTDVTDILASSVVVFEETTGTFDAANTTIAFTDLEIRGMEKFEGHSLAVTAALVHYFCTHDCALDEVLPYF